MSEARGTRSAPRRVGRPPAAAPVTSAEGILGTAEKLLRAQGAGATIADIAAAVGVTKPIVYHHVGNKAAVRSALADRLADRVAERIERAVAGAASPRHGVDLFVQAYLETVQADRDIFLYVSAGGTGTDQVAESLRLADRSVGPLAEGLAALRESHGADPDVATTWAYAVIGMLHFVTLSWIRAPELTAAELAAQLGELLWSGIGGGAE